MANSQAESTELNESWIISRPPGQLHDLPIEFRWEVSRRHPYYLIFWQNALRYRQETPSCEAEELLWQAAFMILGSIGVTGEPIDPKSSYKQLDSDSLDPAFLSGAIQPLTFRALAIMLLNALPMSELATLGALFFSAGLSENAIEEPDQSDLMKKKETLGAIAGMPSAILDSFPETPLVYFHLEAAQRTIVHDVESFVRKWKVKRGISKKRFHTKKLHKLLQIWDLREGWTGSGYEVKKERTFKEIAASNKCSISTVSSQYRHAFQLITGREFSLELWRRVMGPLKLSELFQNEESAGSTKIRHHLGSRTSCDVPESRISGGADQSGSFVADQASEMFSNYEIDLLIDVSELLKRGLSDNQIANELECQVELVEFFRTRTEEFGDI